MSQNPQKPQKNHPNIQGYKICHYKTATSTNDVAKELAKKSNEEKTIVLAEVQKGGKGRMGRQWISPKGGLWFSIILRPQMSPKEALKLTFITSSAVAKTIETMFCLKTAVKWPNDVLVNGRKICGILTETSTRENVIDFVVVGIGINANINLDSFPANLQDTVTSLKHELGYNIRQKTLMKNFLQNFEHRYKLLQRKRWNVLLQEWKGLATFLGKQVEVVSFDEVLVGEAWDVCDDGALILRHKDGVLKRVVVGDVKLRT
jgi:biotin-[acetyl-CoA-carboxylase] ligase BirA-like protein